MRGIALIALFAKSAARTTTIKLDCAILALHSTFCVNLNKALIYCTAIAINEVFSSAACSISADFVDFNAGVFFNLWAGATPRNQVLAFCAPNIVLHMVTSFTPTKAFSISCHIIEASRVAFARVGLWVDYPLFVKASCTSSSIWAGCTAVKFVCASNTLSLFKIETFCTLSTTFLVATILNTVWYIFALENSTLRNVSRFVSTCKTSSFVAGETVNSPLLSTRRDFTLVIYKGDAFFCC